MKTSNKLANMFITYFYNDGKKVIFEDVFTTVSFIVLFLVVLTFVIAIVIQINRNKKIHRSDTPEKSIKTDLNYEFTTTEMNATVVDMMCNTRVVGQKSVKSVEEFLTYID